MTGIFGYYSQDIDEKKVINAIRNLGYAIGEISVHNSCILGSLSIDSSLITKDLIQQGDKGLYVVTCGEIYNEDISDLKKEIITLYESGNLDRLKHINGSFAAAIYDYENEKITLLNDRYGSIKTYYYYDTDCFCFAPKIRPLL